MKESGQALTMIRKSSSTMDASKWMYYILILLVVSLPLSEFGMSLSQFLLLGFWLYEGSNDQKNTVLQHFSALGENFIRKIKLVISNKALMAFIAIYLLHIFGLVYTEDLVYGLKDVRVKLPLLTLPIFLATMKPLSNRQVIVLLSCFVLAVIAGSIASIYTLLSKNINDPREISIFISHIRFALFISFSIFILAYFVFNKVLHTRLTLILSVCGMIWLIVFLFILKSLTGIMITGILVLVVTSFILFKRKALIIPTLSILGIIVIGSWFYIKDVFDDLTVAEKINWQQIEKYTAQGNAYKHDTISYGIENGTYVGMYLSIPELRESWNLRSKIAFDSLDHQKQVLKYTLIRFLHSKGYKKDAEGVNLLTKEEIKQIENGIANANYLDNFSIRSKVDQLLQGYKNYKTENDPNASSFMQRIEYWKTSIWLIKHKPIFGYGTGDTKNAFKEAYDITNSKLLPEFRHRSHNQFLAITIAFGVLGIVVFLLGMLYPSIVLGGYKNYYFLIFFFIVTFSFLTEDTLETQAGATFFALFSSLLLFNINRDKSISKNEFSNKSS